MFFHKKPFLTALLAWCKELTDSRFGCDGRNKFGVFHINLIMNFSLKISVGKALKWSCFWGKRGCVWLHQPRLWVWAWCCAKFPIFHLILEEGDPSLLLLESPGSVFWHCSHHPARPWLGNEGTQQHVALFYLNKDILCVCSMLREEMICSSANQHFCTGFQEGGRSLQPGWAGCAFSSSVQFLNVLYKDCSKREFVEWHRCLWR